MRPLAALALMLALALQPFALCCTAREASAEDATHASTPHHGDDTTSHDAAPGLMPAESCTTTAAAQPALRERSRDFAPALAAFSEAAAVTAQSDATPGRGAADPLDPYLAHPTTPLRL